MRDGLRILDADGHQMEPLSLWQEFMPPGLRARGPRLAWHEGRRVLTLEGQPLLRRPLPDEPDDMLERVRMARSGAELRLSDMDAHGVDVQVLLPTVGGQILGREFRDPELLAACCRAYNAWSVEYVRPAPERLRWIALLPLQDPKLAIEEAHHAAESGAAGAFVRPTPVCGRNLHHPDYTPLWAALEALELPLCLHDLSAPQLPAYGDRLETHTASHIVQHPFEAMSAMTSLIWFGVLDRFPGLRVVQLEADAGWLPYWIQRMEQHWARPGRGEHLELELRPTAYFQRNFWVACRGDEVTLPAVIAALGDERLLFSTDYPHADATWPDGLAALERQPIPRESLRRIFWENGAQLFGRALPPLRRSSGRR